VPVLVGASPFCPWFELGRVRTGGTSFTLHMLRRPGFVSDFGLDVSRQGCCLEVLAVVVGLAHLNLGLKFSHP
jgi:hypothetical protein